MNLAWSDLGLDCGGTAIIADVNFYCYRVLDVDGVSHLSARLDLIAIMPQWFDEYLYPHSVDLSREAIGPIVSPVEGTSWNGGGEIGDLQRKGFIRWIDAIAVFLQGEYGLQINRLLSLVDHELTDDQLCVVSSAFKH
jgi:hypothetical protein